ncbi:MAG: GNAT family N-acetyltransferase [Actinomycetes bacterium]
MHLPTSPRLTFTPVTEADRVFLESCWVLRLLDGTPVGTGIVVDTDGSKELGIELIKEATGIGLGREACEAMLDWLTEHGVREVIAIVQEANEASNGLMKSLGGIEQARYEKWGSRQIHYRITLGP